MTNHAFDALLAPHEGRAAPFLHLPGGDAVGYGAFLDRAAAMAGALADAGVGPGDRIAAQVPKSVDALVLYAACLRAGAVFLPLNTAYTPGEVDYFLRDAGAALFVCDAAAEPALRPVADAAGARVAVLADLAARRGGAPPAADRGSDDLAALLYTSGTTGRSKGAMLTHGNLVSNARALARAWRFTEGDVLLHALPIFHTHGLFVATNVTLVAGGAAILLPKFDLDAVLGALPRATAMMGVPTFYTRLLDDGRLAREGAAHMRLFVSGSAPLLAETHAAFEARTGHRILERYGMTETNMNASNPYDGDRRPGTVGFPLPGVELRVTEPGTTREAPRGEVGMIEVRGPNVFKGYWNMPERTAEELRADGFFVTGDLGLVDADGYLQIVGRGKDLIISGGLNVYPKEVERVLDEQPGVRESAVIGVPDADFGETPLAVLVPEAGTEPDIAAIEAAMRSTLARFKHPRRYVVADALPRNTMGKVQKNVLRETYGAAEVADGAP